jgi:hypothetical protein
MAGGVSMEATLRELRKQRRVATDHGQTERAALLQFLIVVEELSESVGELHERIARLERAVFGSHETPRR